MTPNPGRVVEFLVLVVFMGYFWYAANQFKKTGKFSIRHLAALDTLEEAVGRSTEMGRPVHWSFGAYMQVDAQIFAGFAILGHLARLCARYGTRCIVSIYWPEIVPMCEEIVHNAFVAEGKPEEYRPDDIRFWGGSHNQAMIGTIAREKPGGNFIIGNLGHESVLSLEAGARVGAIQVGGTMNTHQLPFIAAGCDSIFIGAEMFAAGAQIKSTPVNVASVMAEEIIKEAALVLMIIGSVMVTMGDKSLMNLLKM
jgi:hypothetical protein